MKSSLIILFIFLGLLVTSCHTGWDQDTQQLFVQQCSVDFSNYQDKTGPYCQCALEAVIKAYPNQVDAIAAGDSLHFIKDVLQCKSKILGIQ